MKRLTIVLALALVACAEDLHHDHEDPDAGADDPSRVTHTEDGDVTTTQVDATQETAWVYLDLDTRAEVGEGDAWDLAFQRFAIQLDGEVAIVADADFGAMVAAPAGGWITDAPDGDDEDTEPDLAFGGWYAYDPATHTLTPNPLVYVVRTADEGYFKLEMLDYYDDAGSSGFPTFRWAAVAPPA